jgi:hypothetical protein
MSTITLDIPAFRTAIPAFADPAKYTDPLITSQWDMGTSFISASTWGCMPIAARTSALQLMTAHLLYLGDIIAQGGGTGTPGIVVGSKVGDVQVTLAAPPYGTSPWRYWLSLSPYGAQLLVLLQMQAAGGMYIGGLPERAAFRKVGGIF